MSSLRNNRVVIASLFLPATAALGESPLATPDLGAIQPDFTLKFPPGADKKPVHPVLASHTRQSSASTLLPPIKSIVEDLQDKVCLWDLGYLRTEPGALTQGL